MTTNQLGVSLAHVSHSLKQLIDFAPLFQEAGASGYSVSFLRTHMPKLDSKLSQQQLCRSVHQRKRVQLNLKLLKSL